jgi:putative FmdB family regulatory protein
VPVYEYRCKECGYEFDRHQSFAEARLTDCPSCETKGALRKVFGNVGVTFKGSGFYRTPERLPERREEGREVGERLGQEREQDRGQERVEGRLSLSSARARRPW